MTIGKEFMEKTKYEFLQNSPQQQGKPQPSLESPLEEGETIGLPEAKQHSSESLLDLINKRRSLRSYANKELSIEELSYLLWCTQGVKNIIGNKAMLRTAPSAGARHAFETYLIINNCQSLVPGVYRYHASEHSLILIEADNNFGMKLANVCLGQTFISSAAVNFIWVAVLERMHWRYGERGYRYLHLDAGHVCQNLYLAAEAIDAGCCGVGAYDDDRINSLLKLDGETQFVIYLGSVGKRG